MLLSPSCTTSSVTYDNLWLKVNRQRESVVICHIKCPVMLKASANCFVKTHKMHSTKYDYSGMKPKITPEKRGIPHLYIPPLVWGFKSLLSARGARSCIFFPPQRRTFWDTGHPPGCKHARGSLVGRIDRIAGYTPHITAVGCCGWLRLCNLSY